MVWNPHVYLKPIKKVAPDSRLCAAGSNVCGGDIHGFRSNPMSLDPHKGKFGPSVPGQVDCGKCLDYGGTV